MQTFSVAIQKLPGGGYAMTYALDGEAADTSQAYAACSTLHEVFQRVVLPMVQDHFKEAPLYYSQVPPPPPPMSEPLPRVATGPGEPYMPDSLMDRVAGRMNGTLAALGAGLWLSSVWLSMRVGGMA